MDGVGTMAIVNNNGIVILLFLKNISSFFYLVFQLNPFLTMFPGTMNSVCEATIRAASAPAAAALAVVDPWFFC